MVTSYETCPLTALREINLVFYITTKIILAGISQTVKKVF